MSAIRAYATEVFKQTWFRIFAFLGFISTVATFVPRLQDNQALLSWLAGACIFSGYVVANYRIYRKYAVGLSQLRPVIEELKFNSKRLEKITAVTASELRDDTWTSVALNASSIPDEVYKLLSKTYMNIRGAKNIKQSISAVPLGVDIGPEAIRIEEILEELRRILPEVIKKLETLK